MVQKYQNEISPIFYYGKKLKTSGKLLKIPDLQPCDWGQPYWMTRYVLLTLQCLESVSRSLHPCMPLSTPACHYPPLHEAGEAVLLIVSMMSPSGWVKWVTPAPAWLLTLSHLFSPLQLLLWCGQGMVHWSTDPHYTEHFTWASVTHPWLSHCKAPLRLICSVD